jgi:hypothetical protein
MMIEVELMLCAVEDDCTKGQREVIEWLIEPRAELDLNQGGGEPIF